MDRMDRMGTVDIKMEGCAKRDLVTWHDKLVER